MRLTILSLSLLTTTLTAAPQAFAGAATSGGDSCSQVTRIQSYFVDVYLQEQEEQGAWDETLKRVLPLAAGRFGASSPSYIPGGKAASLKPNPKASAFTAAQKKQIHGQIQQLRKQASEAERASVDLLKKSKEKMQKWVKDPAAAEQLEKQASAARNQAASFFDEAARLERKLFPKSLGLQETQIKNQIGWLKRAVKEADQKLLSEMIKAQQSNRGWVKTPLAAAQSEMFAEKARARVVSLQREITALEAQLAKIPGSRTGTNLRVKELTMRSFSSRAAANAAANGVKSSIIRNSLSFVAGQMKGTLLAVALDAAIQIFSAGVGGRDPDHVLACKDMQSCFDLALNDPEKFCEFAKYDPKAMDSFTDGYLALSRLTDDRNRNANERALRMLETLIQGEVALSDLHSTPSDATRIAPAPGTSGRLQ